MVQAREDIPPCFGKHWDPSVPECSGGRDPTYTDPHTQMHVRERCVFFNACGARVQASKNEQKLIPPQDLMRTANTPASSSTSMAFPPSESEVIKQLMRQVAEMTQAQQLLQRQLQLAQQSHPSQFSGFPMPTVPPIDLMAMQMTVPRYLTVPEPRRKGTSVWTMLGREILRSAFKSTGHTLANFWDQTPIDKD